MVADLMYKAEKVWFADGYVHFVLTDRKHVSFPVSLNEKLRNASDEQLSNVELICDGTGIHWPDLDEDLSILGIMEGRFGQQSSISDR